MTHDTLQVTLGWGWTFSQNFSSPTLTVWDRQCLEELELKDDLIINDPTDSGTSSDNINTTSNLVTPSIVFNYSSRELTEDME